MRYGASDGAIYHYNLRKCREHRRHALDAAARIYNLEGFLDD